MGVDMKNSEGYMDLVPYQALTNIEREDGRRHQNPPSVLWFIYAHHLMGLLRKMY